VARIDCQDSLKYPNSKGGKTYEDPKPISGNVPWGLRLSPPRYKQFQVEREARPGKAGMGKEVMS